VCDILKRIDAIISAFFCPAFLNIDVDIYFFQIPITPFDNKLALAQMELAYTTLLNRPTVSKTAGRNTVPGKDGREHPRIVRLAYYAVL
jgi:hypothetical protein